MCQLFDVIFRGGRVLDSERAVWEQADVAVTGKKIVKVGCLDQEQGTVEIDCTEKWFVQG